MRKLLFVLLVMPLCSFGQFSLRPYAGAGYGTISQQGGLLSKEKTSVFIQNAGLSAVYRLHNWFLSAGVEYLTTGYAYEMGTIYSTTINFNGVPIEPPTPLFTNAKLIYKYQHLNMPVTVGRQFSLKKFSILPEAGIDLAYNLSEKGRFTSDEDRDRDYNKNTHFSSDFYRISVFADMRLAIGYTFKDRLSVFCGPSYKYMVTDILKQKTNYLTGATVSQHHQAILLNAGLYIGL